MKSIACSLLFIVAFNVCSAQTIQSTIGSANISETFYDVKYDPSDGSTIQVGIRNDPATSTGDDCFIVKINSMRQIVWQRVLSNPGNDRFNQVIIAANGDYIVTGEYVQSGIFRGLVSRFNPVNGATLWSNTTASTASPNGDKLYDVYETSSNNLVVVGVTNFASGQTNSLVILLNAAGNQVWSRVSSYGSADEFYCVNQLANGNIIIAGFYNAGGSYDALIFELNESTAAVISQRAYQISLNVPGYPFINSLWLNRCKKAGNSIYFSGGGFQGFGAGAAHFIYNYDPVSKNLSGNVLYHSGLQNLTAVSFYPLADNDILISQSYSLPAVNNFVSRITNNAIIYDRRINSNVGSMYATDFLAGNIVFAGNNTLLDAFNLFSTTTFPVSSAPVSCDITNSNTLVLQPTNLTGTSTTIVPLNPVSPVSSNTFTNNATSYILNTICGCITTANNIRYTDVNAIVNQPAQLQARSFTGASYSWSPAVGLSNPLIQNPVFNFMQSQEYFVTISIPGSCDIIDTLRVNVSAQQLQTGIYVPQGFTPNNDGSNDRLYPFLVNIDQLKYFRVFNRWGNLLFETNSGNPATGWDGKYKGKLQPVETYTWTAEGVDIYGKTLKKAGNTLLIN